ncbi:putative triacylglycerol lipase [Rosa chinensis]|uniref:Putative triacylglycerol lipase n=1 Tax=Rosa chinensis TaxID=74649 RepID=A0A2P6PP74_ROSCH|nr:epoxide hydrolase 4 [Rosa chinensis]PRQ23730.1 putative triacylglycerol lipase [Rosa chinensis]
MGNIFAIYKPILHGLMKLAGVRPQTLEIEPGTVMNFWVPTETNSKKSKPAVVFLHGFAVDGIITWQFQVLSLARYYAVYVPDLIFFGGSITDKPDRSPEFQAECVAKGLRKLGVERCTLVGLSYGGMVGFKMAELYPDLVEAFVVTSSVMALNKSVSDAGLGRIGFSRWSDYLLPDSVKGVRDLFEIAAYKFPHLPDWVYRHYLEAMFDNRREREELLKALVISDEDFTVANYPQRVYLLWGANDKIFDIESASNLNKQLGNNASVYHIEKAGHLVQMERPFVYNSQLKKILASLSEDGHQD